MRCQYLVKGVEVPGPLTLSGTVFTDGSCIKSPIPGASRAAWAAVTLDERGAENMVIRGPVPAGLPQTSAAAEYLAFQACAQHLQGPTSVGSDYANLVHRMAAVGTKIPAKLMYSGVVRQALTATGACHVKGVYKIAAHQDIDEVPLHNLVDALGNALADSSAKAALSCHPPLPPAWLQMQSALRTANLEFLTFVATAMPLWPSLREQGGS